MAQVRSRRAALLAIAAVLAVGSAIALEYRYTAPIRGSVRALTELIAAANRGDLATVRALYTRSHLAGQPPEAAPEGGVIGLPRAIHPNFQAWRRGDSVWICPTNRTGPVYRFRRERGRWRFDGLVGLLGADGEIRRLAADPHGSM